MNSGKFGWLRNTSFAPPGANKAVGEGRVPTISSVAWNGAEKTLSKDVEFDPQLPIEDEKSMCVGAGDSVAIEPESVGEGSIIGVASGTVLLRLRRVATTPPSHVLAVLLEANTLVPLPLHAGGMRGGKGGAAKIIGACSFPLQHPCDSDPWPCGTSSGSGGSGAEARCLAAATAPSSSPGGSLASTAPSAACSSAALARSACE